MAGHRIDHLKRLVMVGGLVFVLSPAQVLAWWDDAWSRRRTITFDNSAQASNLMSFPVLIKLDASRVEYDLTQNAGQDLRFVDADDSTVLDHEIELWDETGTSYVWVRVPQVDASSNTDFIYMYYGNENAADGQNATGVWSANYLGVWHLKEDPSGAPPQMTDSTSNGHHGTSGGFMTPGDQVGGQIDGSLDFDGGDDFVATGTNNIMANLASFTMSAWVLPRAGQPEWAGIVDYDDSSSGNDFEAGIEMRASGVPRVNIWTTSGFQFVDSATVLPTTGWSHLVSVYDGSNLLLYIDGALDSTSPPITGNTRNINRPVHIGRNTHDARYFNGLIDEVRISDTPRTADWIAAQHMSTTDTFATFGVVEGESACAVSNSFWWDTDWGARAKITFNNTAQAEDLDDFPVLIRLDSGRIDYGRTLANGWDIRFVDADHETVLAHEIEEWNPAGSSYVWVRIPRINGSSATDFIWMYYDNGAVGNGENVNGVWDASYRGVWHLRENGSPYAESTANPNPGTSGSPPTRTTGRIGYGQDFDVLAANFIDAGNDSSLDLTGAVTLEAWVQLQSVIAGSWGADFIGKEDQYRLYHDWDTNRRVTFMAGTATPQYPSDDPVALNTWLYVVGVYDGTDNAYIYVDGVLRDSVSGAGAPIISSPLNVGIGRDLDDNETFEGLIDEVRISSTPRTGDWIRAQHLSMTDAFVSFSEDIGVCNLRSIGTRGDYGQGGVEGQLTTVSVTNGSRVVTGAGTGWKSANRGRGDRITINGVHYVVGWVVSDTELRLTSVYRGGTAAGLNYTIARQFPTLQPWENCISGGGGCGFFPANLGDLVGDNRAETGIAYDDSVFTLSSSVVINGSTTDVAHTITLTADGVNRHYGTVGTGVIVDAALDSNEILVYTPNVTIEWLELRGLRGPSSSRGVIRVLDPSTNILLQNLLIHDFHDPDGSPTCPLGNCDLSGIRLSGNPGKSVTVRNTMIWDGDQHGIEADAVGDALTIENCTIDDIRDTTGSRRGVYAGDTLGVIVRNTIATRSGTDFGPGAGSFAAGPTSTNNISSDGTAPGDNPLTVPPASIDALYVTPGSDLHLETGAVAIDTGLNLSSSFAFDIDHQVRPAGAAWDRGADEFGAATAVKLMALEAKGLDSAAEVSWRTGSELDNLGFHLYRSTPDEGPYTRITSRLIPGLGSSPQGARYSYRDTGLVNGVTYYYKLEDIETTGKTEMHGPVSATPRAGAGSGGESSRITVGEPEETGFHVVSERPGELVLELLTGGFYAEPLDDGTVHLEVPGFSLTEEEGFPTLPVKRSWVPIVAGRRVKLVSVETFEEEVFDHVRPENAGGVVVEAGRRTVKIARERRRAVAKASAFAEASADKSARVGLYPEQPAQLLETAFQEEVKKVLVEMAPLRWDGSRRRLLLAHRIVVRLKLGGRERTERTVDGLRGRRYRRRTSHEPRRVVARLVTKEKGLYGVGFEEVFGGKRAVASSLLRLSRLGEPVAFYVQGATFGPGATLYFVSEGAAANPYGNEAVYELESGVAGERMMSRSAVPDGEPTPYYWERVENEDERIYQAALVHAPDRWLWSALYAPARESFSFEVSELAAEAESSRLTVWLQGGSDFPADPDHHVRLTVNGSFVGETSWNGKEPRRMDAEIGRGILHDGENTLEIESVKDTEAAYSMVMVDRFEVSYPRRLEAREGRLEGLWSRSGTAEIAGVTEGIVVEEAGEDVRWLEGVETTVSGIRFRAEADRVYMVVSPEAVLKVAEVRPGVTSRLKDTSHRVDYVMIGPREFLPSAEALLELRRSQRLRVKAVAVEEVFEAFGFGEENPKAIQDFLSYAYHQWAVGPRYVVLLGDGTYDFKDHLGTGVVNRVPPLMVMTSYIETASDPAYAAVNGDDLLPDLAIGRLPASTVEELQAMVAKIVAFETSGGSFEGRAVLVTDNPDRAGDFVADAESLAATILSTTELEKIYLSRLGAAVTRDKIQRAFDEGSSLMSYIGHGGIHLWADENIFNIWDVPSLSPQSTQPIVLTMNCLNGYFHFPYFNALAEEVMKADGKGAIAVFSPSGLSLNDAAHVFHRALLQELLNGGHGRLGDAVLAAQAAYAESGALPEMLAIYHLFGDPAMTLR